MVRFLVYVLSAFLFSVAPVFSLTPEEERQLLKDVAEMKAILKMHMEQTNEKFEDMNRKFEARFEQIDKRFEDINRRFEDMNKRFEDMSKRVEELRQDMNARFDHMFNFLYILSGIFTTLTLGVIGFAYWDRRTVIRKAREEAVGEIDREINIERVKRLWSVLKEKSETDEELRSILQKHGLL